MAQKRTEAWLAVAAVAIGLPVLAIVAFVSYVSSRPPLHPDAAAVTSVMGSTPLPKWAGAADESRPVVRAGVAQQNVPGVSVAVGVAGEIVWAEGFGWANVETHAPVTPDTRFRIGHVSKAITSAGVGRLVEAGRLGLGERIQTYVPAFPEKAWPVTVRDLMAHIAGVRHYRDTEWGDKPTAHCDRAAEGVSAFANDPLLFQPGTEYRYSTYGWVLVSAAVEAAAGKPFIEVMRAQVFDPTAMSHTSADAPREALADRATSYYQNNFGNETTTGVDYSCFAGGGAFLSTPSDLVRFGFAVNSGTFLKPDTVRTLQSPQRLTAGTDTAYGLGWMLETIELAGEPTRMAGHASRTIEGASTSFLTFPDRGLVVAVSSNLSFADMRSIAVAIAGAFAKAAK